MKFVQYTLWVMVYLCLFFYFFIYFQYDPSHFVEGAGAQVTAVKKLIGLAK